MRNSVFQKETVLLVEQEEYLLIICYPTYEPEIVSNSAFSVLEEKYSWMVNCHVKAVTAESTMPYLSCLEEENFVFSLYFPASRLLRFCNSHMLIRLYKEDQERTLGMKGEKNIE